jgi:catechol 2,3-dioxygenase-like lactoylglutathione lyase family enzyme
MTEQTAESQVVHQWYMRPVLFVADVNRSLRFYVDELGFWKKWHQGTVCQVNRGDCEIILCEHETRRDKARLFIELNVPGLAELRREIAERSIPTKDTWWGYDSIQIDDPDGNELLFPVEDNSPAPAN